MQSAIRCILIGLFHRTHTHTHIHPFRPLFPTKNPPYSLSFHKKPARFLTLGATSLPRSSLWHPSRASGPAHARGSAEWNRDSAPSGSYNFDLRSIASVRNSSMADAA